MDTTAFSKIKKMSPQLLVADVDASIDFYTKKIGFDLDFRYEDFYAGIIKDGYSIHLKSGKPSLKERQNKLKNDDLDIVFSIEGVEDLYNDFVNKSIQITQPLCDRPYGKEFYIADLDGYILAFLEEAG
jgi:catechol 2,3-dioxygenase-like lactoylglutathione lyase family enzyme